MIVVASGSMAIRSTGMLKACLGSCVGLAVLAPRCHLGGLLHILLPEPTCDIPKSHHTHYAATGVPAFLAALAKRGVRPEDMSVYLAGGGLMGPVSHLDLVRNIGGKTLEICLSILKQHRIAIHYLEASGMMGFCMMLDIDRAKCTVEPVWMERWKTSVRVIPTPTQHQISHEIENLHPIPQIVMSINGMLSDDAVGFGEVSAALRKDQVLTADVLRLCRRLEHSSARPIDTIDEGLLMLGSKRLLRLIITAHLNRLLSKITGGYSLVRGGLFHHALATARLSESLAMATGLEDPNLAYTAGLLHDIGKIVLDQYAACNQPLFYRMLGEEHNDLVRLEQKLFGIEHPVSGFLLAEQWKLPESIKEAIRFHHLPAHACRYQTLVRLISLADYLAHQFLPGYVMESHHISALEESMPMLELAPEQVSQCLSVLTEIF